MIHCSPIGRATRPATSSFMRIPRVTRLESVFWVSVPRKRVQRPQAPASEGEPDILIMEVVRTNEVLPEVAFGASPTTAKVSSMEPARISVAVVAEAVEAVSPLGNTLTICKQSFLDIIIPCFNEVLLQVFHLLVHRLRGNRRVFWRNSGER